MVLAFFAALLLREKACDYTENTDESISQQFNFKPLAKKYVVWWIIFLELNQIGIILIVPYFPIYLNNFLHI